MNVFIDKDIDIIIDQRVAGILFSLIFKFRGWKHCNLLPIDFWEEMIEIIVIFFVSTVKNFSCIFQIILLIGLFGSCSSHFCETSRGKGGRLVEV